MNEFSFSFGDVPPVSWNRSLGAWPHLGRALRCRAKEPSRSRLRRPWGAGRVRAGSRRARRRKCTMRRLPEPPAARSHAGPAYLTGMEDAAQRGSPTRFSRREKVAIFGDYDVDGACSAALLAEYLRACGLAYLIHIPDRITEGYGPNIEAIRGLAEQGAELLVTVDCGTASHRAARRGTRLGLDAVVLDHHQAPEQLPEAVAIVNPNRPGRSLGPRPSLRCRRGVPHTRRAQPRPARTGILPGGPEPDLLREPRSRRARDRRRRGAARGLNRAFVRQGLIVMRGRAPSWSGRASRCRGPGRGARMLAPRISRRAAHQCRRPHRRRGARRAPSAHRRSDRGGRLRGELDRLNRERQAIEARPWRKPRRRRTSRSNGDPELPVLVTASAEWHPGIVGLIAARLKERFRRPSFAFALNADGTATGSGRSVAGRRSRPRGPGRRRCGGCAQGRRARHGGGGDDAADELRSLQAFIATSSLLSRVGQCAAPGPFRHRRDADRRRRPDQHCGRDRAGRAFRFGAAGADLRLRQSPCRRSARGRQRRAYPRKAACRRRRLHRRHRVPGGRPAAWAITGRCGRQAIFTSPERCPSIAGAAAKKWACALWMRRGPNRSFLRLPLRLNPSICPPTSAAKPRSAAFVYRLGHQPFTLGRGVRLP